MTSQRLRNARTQLETTSAVSFSLFSNRHTMNHYIADLEADDVAEVEKRTNATGDNISGIALVVF
jgi:hypothetical protein